MEAPSTLLVVPARAESEEELDALLQTLVALRSTAPDAMVLVVDRSPGSQAAMIEVAAGELDCVHVTHTGNHSAAANTGLNAAAQHGLDAVLFAQGLVPDPGWLARLRARTGADGSPAAVAGGVVFEPTGFIRHAGYFFSVFRRGWTARLGRMPEEVLAVAIPTLCPVSTELMLIRRATIEQVGLLDEELENAPAALDYCFRVADAGGDCVLEPTVRARALAPGDGEPEDTTPSARRLRAKHAAMSFQPWAVEVL